MPVDPQTRRGAVRAVALAAFLTGVLTVAAPAVTVVTAEAASPGETVDRVVRDARISESSGLAVSLRDPGVLWTHNDSGHPARLFAIGADGRTRATVRVRGVPAVDWEAMASFRDAAGRPMLAVADTGDNGAVRDTVSIVVLAEPALRDATVSPERMIRVRYPTGAVDAEALLVDPDGRRAFVVTKGLGSTIYQVPPAAWTGAAGGTATLERRASTPLLLVTDAVMGPGGHPLLRTYGELAVLPPLDGSGDAGSLQPLADLRLPDQEQGESLALRDSRTVLVGSEGTDQPVLRVTLPADATSAWAPGATAPTPSPWRTGTPSPEPVRSGSFWPGAPAGLLLPGGMLCLVVLVAVRRRR